MEIKDTIVHTLVENEFKHIYVIERNNKLFVLKQFFQHDNIQVYKKVRFASCSFFPTIVEINEFEDGFEVVEDFVEGTTLRDCMPMDDMDLIIRYAIQICAGLKYLHSKDIVHRDLKPENIMVHKDRIKIIDFDIAKQIKIEQSKDTQILGSLGYAAPEQYGFSSSDARSDIYALGNIINEMCNGELANVKLTDTQLKSVVLKCTHIDPEQRYRNTDEVEVALNKARVKKSKYALPGFRSGVFLNAFIASIVYLISAFFVAIVEDGESERFIDHLHSKFLLFGLLAITIMVCTNYLGIHQLNPLKKFRIVGHVLIWIALFFAYVMVMQFIFVVFAGSIPIL